MAEYDYLCGIGFDMHKLSTQSASSTLKLCGIDVPHEYRIIAHSDGDVALHAVVDAILGALAKGDIGDYFPPSDPQWKDASSVKFIQHAMQLVEQEQAQLINLDLTFICEAPKIGPHKQAMRENLTRLLNLDIKRVSVKATTTEKLGSLGRKEGIAVQAIVTIKVPCIPHSEN